MLDMAIDEVSAPSRVDPFVRDATTMRL